MGSAELGVRVAGGGKEENGNSNAAAGPVKTGNSWLVKEASLRYLGKPHQALRLWERNK